MVRMGDLLRTAAAAALSAKKIQNLPANSGLPELQVMYTEDVAEARTFLDEHMDSEVLGLDLTWKEESQMEFFPRSSLLQIAAGQSVLIFDLLPRPENNKPPKAIPKQLCSFLQQRNRTFYDVALTTHSARIAFELNCAMNAQSVDLSKCGRTWIAHASSTIFELAREVFNTNARPGSGAHASSWEERPLTMRQLQVLAQKAYLNWAVADHFLRTRGPAHKEARVTRSQMMDASNDLRAIGMPIRKTRFDWSKVKRSHDSRVMTPLPQRKVEQLAQVAQIHLAEAPQPTRQAVVQPDVARRLRKLEAGEVTEDEDSFEKRKKERREKAAKRRAEKAAKQADKGIVPAVATSVAGGSRRVSVGKGGAKPVAPTLFFQSKAQAFQNVVLATLRKHSEWHNLVAGLVKEYRIKVTSTVTSDGRFVASHLTLHRDNILIKLGQKYNFPRGFVVIIDVSGVSEDGKQGAGRFAGHGTFYPKFGNDDRNAAFSSKDFGGVTAISCVLKYSGSAGIITVIRDANGRAIGWTGSSKNSCNHGPNQRGTSYPREVAAIFGEHGTQAFLAWCDRHGVSSLGLEVFIDTDQSHGYGYARSGFIVTAVCVDGDTDGRPVYLAPQRLYEACHELGLPTDRPIVVEGKENVKGFVQSLSAVRNFLTLSSLRHVLSDRHLMELDTMHESLIDSQIVEGFVIRRWKGDSEIRSVKFKSWLYQMVTQVLRPSFMGGHNNLEFRSGLNSLKGGNGKLRPSFIKKVDLILPRWCISKQEATLKRCRDILYHAARASLPAGHPQLMWTEKSNKAFPADAPVPKGCLPRDPNRAYWITLADHAVDHLVATSDTASLLA